MSITFASDMNRRMLLAGITQAAIAAAIPLDKGYVSKLVNGHQLPSRETAAAIDRLLNADGQLLGVFDQQQHQEPPVDEAHRPFDGTDVERIRGTIAHLVALDTAHGSDGLSLVAVRAFRDAQDHLSTAGVLPADAADVHAAVAELGEVAAWLTYDAEDQDTSRQVATEAALVARLAGDTSMERFLLSHLSMQAVYTGRGAEALAIADRVIAEDPKSKRVVGMMRLRRARALGVLGNRTEAMAELNAARAVLLDGLRPEDPQWSWWLHEAELSVHEGRLLAATGDQRGAVKASLRAVQALPARQGRDQSLYRAWLLRDLVDARAWRDAEHVAAELTARAPVAGSARVPKLLRGTMTAVRQPGLRAPRWLVDAVEEAAEKSRRG